jgi:exportin-2 (importin alpha re-exporter)
VDASVRPAASVLFKNFVKKNWNTNVETEDLIPIPQEERELIKSNLVQLMATAQPDMNVLNGALSTANSILKRFRYVERSDTLYKDILYTLELLQQPLLALFQHVGKVVDSMTAADPKQLNPCIDALRTMCRIFYSLN